MCVLVYALGHARNLPAFWRSEAVSQRPDISGEEFDVERVGWGRDGSRENCSGSHDRLILLTSTIPKARAHFSPQGPALRHFKDLIQHSTHLTPTSGLHSLKMEERILEL